MSVFRISDTSALIILRESGGYGTEAAEEPGDQPLAEGEKDARHRAHQCHAYDGAQTHLPAQKKARQADETGGAVCREGFFGIRNECVRCANGF